MPVLKPGTQEYKDYYNAVNLPGDTPPAQQQQDDDRSDGDDGNGHGGIRAPMSDRDEYYSQQPNVPPADVDTPYDKAEHEPKTDKGRAADARLRSDMQKAGIAQQQRALDESKATIQEQKLLSQIVPGEAVGRWAVQTENGRKFFMAVSEDQALRQARTAGLHPTSARLTSIHTYTEDELAEAYAKIGKCGGRASRRDEFERAIKMGLVPEDAEFETIGDREWGYRVGHDPTVHKASEKEWVYQPPADRAALARLEKYWDGTGYNLVAAISDGVTDGTLYRAGFVPADVKEIRDWVKKHDEVLSKLQPYWSEPKPASTHDLARTGFQAAGYNIEAALKAGAVSASDLIDVGFERADILEATERVSVESFPATTRHEQFHSDVVSKWEHAYPEAAERLQEAGLGFDIDTIKKIDREMKDRDVFAVGDAPTADKLLQVLAAAKADGVKTPEVDEVWRIWHEGADEYKSWLIGLPREHPEKKTMLRRAGNVVLAATTVLLPGVQAAATSVGRAGMSLLGPALKSRRVTQVAQSAVGFVSNALLPSSVLTADAAVVNEVLNADNMQRKHEAFLLLPQDEQDYWKQKAGVDPKKPCGDTDMARVLAHYSVPAGYSLSEWSSALQNATDTMGEKADVVSAWVRERTPKAVSEPVVFAGNTAVGVVEGMSYGAQLPMIAASIADRVPEGDAKEYAAQVAAGMVAFFAAIPGRLKADPSATSGRLIGMFILSPKAWVKYAKGLGVRLDPRFITKKALGTEFTTLRISPPSGSVAKRSDWVAVKAQIGNAKRIVLDLDGTLVDGNGRLLPGAKAFVTGLKAGRELILWTHSTEARASAILKDSGLRPYFDTIITREGYEPTGTNPMAFKDIRRVKGDVLIDDVAATNPAYSGSGIKVVAPSVGGTIRISPKEMMKLTDELVRQSIFTRTKVARATIKTQAGEWVAEIRNTPYQRVLNGSSFHFTSDITPFLKNKKVVVNDLPLFHSPQAAIEFAVQHWTGRPMVRPGLVEIHMTKPELRGLTKILSRGVAEFEGSFAPGTELHAVPGFNGRGVSFDLRAGSFPIVRYTTAGAKGWKGPTPAELAQVHVEAAKAATADFLLGWYGRMTALKDALFKKDWKLERINQAIAQLKAEKPETIGPDGEIVGLRSPVPHPDGKGTIRPRVTGIIHNPENGRILLVMDKTEKAFSLPGGHILQAWRPGALGFKKLPDGRVVNTFDGALDGQMRTETGVGITGAKPLDIYRGKVNEHAMAGSRVYEATATSAALDPAAASRQYSKSAVPELQKYVWWDGKSDITVYPAVRDILLGVAKQHKLDMTKVHVYTADKVLLKARDRQYFYRVRSGNGIAEKQIAAINKREIDSLKWQRSEYLKGQTPELVDFLEAEPELWSIIEFLEGRRRVVKTYTAGKTDAVVERAITEAQLMPQYAEALRTENRGERARRVADVYDEAVRAHLETGRLAEPYRDALYAAARENMPAYGARYLHYYRRATQSRTDPVRQVKVAHEDESSRALREYRDVYRATSEPSRVRYEPWSEQVRRVPDARRTGDRPRFDARGGDYRVPSDYRGAPPPPPGEEPVLPRSVPTPPEAEERAPRRRQGLGTSIPDKRTRDTTGRVQWRQGNVWIMVEPPPTEGERQRNVFYSRRPFWGVPVVKGTPEQTFAYQGNPPKRFLYEMGITSADIFAREKPHLRYRQTAAGRANNRKGRRGRVMR